MHAHATLSAKSAKIFVRNVTILDCALLHKTVGPRGRSWHVDIIWEGETDANGIVFDFSLAKKAAKEAIDSLFDHRLVVPASCVTALGNNRSLVRSAYSLRSEFESARKSAPECAFALNTYSSALAIVPDAALDSLSADNDSLEFAHVLAQAVHKNSPSNISKVLVHLRDHEEYGKSQFFSYTHSLKYHFGNCQRFHGHSNIVEVFTNAKPDVEAAEKLAESLNARYLVPPCYLVQDPQGEHFAQMFRLCPELLIRTDLSFVSYEGSQGQVALALPTAAVILMESESTIENIAQFAHTHAQLEAHQTVVAYEGLAKGSMFP